MGLQSLAVSGLQRFERVELSPAPGLNLVTGPNASGKTSLLEAVFLLGRGRSFRAARREAMIREGCEALKVVGQLADGRVLGFEVGRSAWKARAAGQPVTQLAELAGLLPVQLLDPEVHRLVQDGPGERRRYLDWATFHVKPGFLETWRGYQRALRQRNAGLRSKLPDRALQAWEAGMTEYGSRLDQLREEALEALAGPVNEVARRLLDSELRMNYRSGQPDDQDLAEALARYRERDRRVGITQVGPHRADVVLAVDSHKARGWVSRGQQKLVAAAMVLGQAAVLAPGWQGRGVLLVDDPAAELDSMHCRALLEVISGLPFQVFLTAFDARILPGLKPARTFHVERGRVLPVV